MSDESIDRIISRYPAKPSSLIHVLMAIQHEHHWLPRDVLKKVSTTLDVPLSQVLHIATFYKTFSLTPRGRHEVRVCTGTSCHVRGAEKLLDQVRQVTGLDPGQTDAEARFSLDTGCCLGSCSLGPEMIVDGEHHGRMTPESAEAVLKQYQ